ncbi:MAG: hypothetical protein QJR13_01125 [Bacillota bacterium]|nr:hypothetical protein [Bacillota bacterium]
MAARSAQVLRSRFLWAWLAGGILAAELWGAAFFQARAASLGDPSLMGPGVRAWGMGGAFVALAEDATAAYWNPAGIVQIRRFAITPSVTVKTTDWEALSAVTDLHRLGELYPEKNQFTGEVEVTAMPLGFATSRFGVNVLGEGRGQWQVDRSPTDSTSSFSSLYTVASTMTFGLPLVDLPLLGRLSAGVNLKAYNGRYQSWKEENEKVTEQSAEGQGYGVDLGLQSRLTPWVRAGLVVRDLSSDLKWKGDLPPAGEELPTRRPRVLQAGVALCPPGGWTLAGDLVRNLDGGAESYRVGLEKTIFGVLALRGGVLMSRSEAPTATAGLGLAWGPVHLDLAAASAEGLRRLEAASLGLAVGF